jgi:hypothetical protein
MSSSISEKINSVLGVTVGSIVVYGFGGALALGVFTLLGYGVTLLGNAMLGSPFTEQQVLTAGGVATAGLCAWAIFSLFRNKSND